MTGYTLQDGSPNYLTLNIEKSQSQRKWDKDISQTTRWIKTKIPADQQQKGQVTTNWGTGEVWWEQCLLAQKVHSTAQDAADGWKLGAKLLGWLGNLTEQEAMKQRATFLQEEEAVWARKKKEEQTAALSSAGA